MTDLTQFAELGGLVVLSLVIFLMYRRDRNNTETMWRESKKFTENRLTDLLEKDQETREANTKVLSEVSILIRRMNGRPGA